MFRLTILAAFVLVSAHLQAQSGPADGHKNQFDNVLSPELVESVRAIDLFLLETEKSGDIEWSLAQLRDWLNDKIIGKPAPRGTEAELTKSIVHLSEVKGEELCTKEVSQVLKNIQTGIERAIERDIQVDRVREIQNNFFSKFQSCLPTFKKEYQRVYARVPQDLKSQVSGIVAGFVQQRIRTHSVDDHLRLARPLKNYPADVLWMLATTTEKVHNYNIRFYRETHLMDKNDEEDRQNINDYYNVQNSRIKGPALTRMMEKQWFKPCRSYVNYYKGAFEAASLALSRPMSSDWEEKDDNDRAFFRSWVNYYMCNLLVDSAEELSSSLLAAVEKSENDP